MLQQSVAGIAILLCACTRVMCAPASTTTALDPIFRYFDPLYDPGFEYRPYPIGDGDKSKKPNNGAGAVRALGTAKPAVILKLDDLDAGNFDQFEQVASFIRGKRLRASFGVITQRMAGTGRSTISQRMCRWLLEKQKTGRFEIWNHGLMHLPGEMDEKDLNGQARVLNRSQELLKGCGLKINAYGAPYNAANNYTLAALRTQPDIKLWFFPTPGTFTAEDLAANSPIILDPRRTRLDVELATGIISFDFFKTNYAKVIARNTTPIFVLQGHPPKWNMDSFRNFTRIVNYLLAEGHDFVKPTEYLTGRMKTR